MKFGLISLITYSLFWSIVFGQSQEVKITTIKLSDNVYMLRGSGGNIGISTGSNGVFIIDDQFAKLTPKIIAAIKTISSEPLTILVNTHHHGDHTGGNQNMAKEGVNIIAHENVRQRLVDQSNPMEALPIITFNDRLSIFINGEKVSVYHVEHAHTDGDAILYFSQSNVLHAGDTYFQNRYPYIDLKSGGSIDGYINAVKKALSIINNDTKIIPGHGSISNKKEFFTFLTMLETLRNNVQNEIDKGKNEDEVAANSNITKEYDDLNYSWAFITSEKIRRTIYQSLQH
ncbi:MBL fold metallo-hydrolase [Flavobacteriaceae bacterium]|jgi:cyclase|nr:MBL fold metallo-hydrolase [Flavobacteriaceae bacterium]